MKDIFKTIDIFTPVQKADVNFIQRSNLKSLLTQSIYTPGVQIIIYGYTGCGKSSLYSKLLKELDYSSNMFITRCTSEMNVLSIKQDIFSKLTTFIDTEKTISNSTKITPELELEYADLKANFRLFSIENSIENKKAPQNYNLLFAENIARLLGFSNSIWIIEDFHKVKDSDKVVLSEIMKIFADMADEFPFLKIIALGAVGTARQVVDYNREMNNRIAEIHVPYMSDNEIIEIISNGEKQLNVIFPKSVKKKIAKFSCGVPSICHNLCKIMCLDKNIYETQTKRISFEDEDLNDAIQKLLLTKSDSLKSDYDQSMKGMKNRNYVKIILENVLSMSEDDFSSDQLWNLCKPNMSKVTFNRYLNELCTANRAEILIYDDITSLYRFNNLIVKSYYQLKFKDNIIENVRNSRTRGDGRNRLVEEWYNLIEADMQAHEDLALEYNDLY